jgi:hypothetical protein
MGLPEKEVEYFYLLVEFGRAGSVKLQKQFLKRIEEQKKIIQPHSHRCEPH